jgi:hypothetical protein
MGVNLMENLLHERAYDLDFFVQKKIEKNPLNQSVPELTEKFMNKTRQIERVSEEVTEEVIRREIDSGRGTAFGKSKKREGENTGFNGIGM